MWKITFTALLLTASLSAQDSLVSVSGRVEYRKNLAFHGAAVAIVSASDTIARQECDSLGEFHFHVPLDRTKEYRLNLRGYPRDRTVFHAPFEDFLDYRIDLTLTYHPHPSENAIWFDPQLTTISESESLEFVIAMMKQYPRFNLVIVQYKRNDESLLLAKDRNNYLQRELMKNGIGKSRVLFQAACGTTDEYACEEPFAHWEIVDVSGEQ